MRKFRHLHRYDTFSAQSASLGRLPLHTYFIRTTGNVLRPVVKIGVTTSPSTRITGICAGSPVPVSLWHQEVAHPEYEQAMHVRFAADRANGEWFYITPEIEGFVQALIEGARLRDLIDPNDYLIGVPMREA